MPSVVPWCPSGCDGSGQGYGRLLGVFIDDLIHYGYFFIRWLVLPYGDMGNVFVSVSPDLVIDALDDRPVLPGKDRFVEERFSVGSQHISMGDVDKLKQLHWPYRYLGSFLAGGEDKAGDGNGLIGLFVHGLSLSLYDPYTDYLYFILLYPL